MTKQEIAQLARASTRPEGACPFAWWISPFVVDCEVSMEQKQARRDEEQLDLFGLENPLEKRTKSL